MRSEFPKHILKIDLKQLRDRLEQEPWIRQADVRRILPSELVIRIREREPSVILELRGELMLSDSDGILLDRYHSKYGKLDVPVFKGFTGDDPDTFRSHQEENAARVRLGLKILAELESGSPEFTQNISEVDLSDPANVKVLLVDDTAEIFLGDRDFLKRFQTLMANLPQYRDLRAQYRDIASVDLRFDGQIVYRPRPVPAAQATEAAEVRP